MAKVSAIAGSVLLSGHAVRVELYEEDALSNHCASFNGYTYAKCSVLEEDTTLLQKVCNSPHSKSKMIAALKKDKCIQCNNAQLVEYCKDQIEECSTEKIGADKEEEVCKLSMFGRSAKGRQFTDEEFGKYLADHLASTCTQMSVAIHCEQYQFQTCDTLKTEYDEHFCELVKKESAALAVSNIGARLGIKCSNAEIRAKCGKETCSTLDQDEWDTFCDEKANAGLSAEDAVEMVGEDALTCSTDLIKSKCPLPCTMDAQQEQLACFGYSAKGRKGVKFSPIRGCDENQVKAYCGDKDWPTCASIETAVKHQIKDKLCPNRTPEMADQLGAQLGVKCSEDDLNKLCE